MRKTSSGPLPLNATAFGLRAKRVLLLQTHIGWVYLAGKYAFKLKKRVKFDFLDFTTLPKRRWACERELSLNRRLCPHLYLGLRPVLKAPNGRTFLGPPGMETPFIGHKIVDWAVWMRRLPEGRMLNDLLTTGGVTRAKVQALARMLAAFYLKQRGQFAPGGLGDLAAVRGNIAENLREGKDLDPGVLANGALALLTARANYFFKRYGALIQKRARAGFIVDGHGDLRAENICLPKNAPPVLFDCIEFNDRFRIADSAMDIAFLAMDLDSRGREDLSRAFLATYQAACDKNLPPRLLNFYLGYRAFVKGKVAAWIAADAQVSPPQRAASTVQARELFDLAVRYALRNQPALFVFCGVPGTGKSSLAQEFSRRLQCQHFATDWLRDEIIPRGRPEATRYSRATSDKTYGLLFKRAAIELKAGRQAVIDGTFIRSERRRAAVALARKLGVPAILIWADCEPKIRNKRIAARAKNGTAFGSEADTAIAAAIASQFQRPTIKEGFSALCRIDTSGALDESQRHTWDTVLRSLAKL